MDTAIARTIAAWMADPANNALAPGLDEPAFDTPLVGCASGADPLFDWLRNDIGPDFYWTPAEPLSLAFPDRKIRPEDVTVIAWVLPQTARTLEAHRRCRLLPSLPWSQVRHYGEMINENLRRFVVETLVGQGRAAVAPVLLPQWDRATSARYGFASRWSERHAAHVCGLGTFGLSDGLITPAGKAVRVGSVVAEMVLPPTPRPYARHDAWCLRAAGVPCRSCIKRCPAGAISEAGHDKQLCYNYIRNVTAPYVAREQMPGIPVNSCGLCQTGTPCEHGIPKRPRNRPAGETAGGQAGQGEAAG
ncbi:4Fe-4S ferredoxin [Desulfovibrio sp. TomC]|uniref:4Fe-4S ferredoxin n=1 Tax=Desulfovibrio sp. TomC TaxID=1562888 RepID=UPI000575C2EF|nr:4Fe-4S ferredoxin [Desulfovibrio sp. TomC]KHK03447.1 Iron-sulfur cluster-binding protein [Desulfovibrio sp. TomC]